MAKFESVSVGDTVIYPGDFNGWITDGKGIVRSIGKNRDGCSVELLEPVVIEVDGELIERRWMFVNPGSLVKQS